MRINARLDLSYENKISDIIHETKENITDVLKKSIDLYHQKIKEKSVNGARALRQSKFIGSAKTLEKDLSTNYKKDLFSK